MAKQVTESDSKKRQRVKSFLDRAYEILKDGTEKNTLEITQELKNHKLSSEYLTALKIAKVTEKKGGKIIWLQGKPTLKLTDMLMGLAANIIVKRNTNYRGKQTENLFSFMRNVYRKIGKVPKTLDDLGYIKILNKFELSPQYGEALIAKNLIKPQKLLTKGKEVSGYIWNGKEPDKKMAEKIYNFVLNMTQKAKKTKKRSQTDDMKFISQYGDFISHMRKSKQANA